MPRPRTQEPRDQQLLLRLTARQLKVLESVAHLERTKPNAYAHQVLVEHLASMANNTRVQADLTNRASYDADAVAASPLRERGEGAAKVAVEGNRSGRKQNTS